MKALLELLFTKLGQMVDELAGISGQIGPLTDALRDLHEDLKNDKKA